MPIFSLDLSLSESQEQLKSTAREFMEREAPRQVLIQLSETETGFNPDAWKRVADIGFLGMLALEQYGGTGSSLMDCAVVFEELGKGPLSGPFFSSGVLANLIVQEAATEEQKRRLLPAIASGQEIATLAMTEPDYGWDAGAIRMRARATRNGYVLDGVKLFVHDATSATQFICPVRTAEGSDPAHGVSLLMVDANSPGLSRRLLPGFMGWVGEVKFNSVEVPRSAVLGQAGAAWAPLQRAIQKAIPVLCAYQVGGCTAVFEMSVEYSRTRIQFGVPIGRFQRVQDHIIEAVNHRDAARWTTYEALWKLDTGRPAATSVHLAKVVASDGYYQACNYAHEAHGGIGTDLTYGLPLHTKMSRALYHFLGDPAYHRRRLAETLDF